MITRKELIKRYIEFFKAKNHNEIANSSLMPENDPTVLFTTAGMHPLVPFLLGQKHPLGKRLVGVQRCIRTGDIEEVGDEVHHTFFEMLGNWSLGDYWKEEAIKFSFDFLTKELKIPKEKISVTCFKGEGKIPKDIEAEKAWESLGVKKDKIKFLSKKDNWWGPAGKTGPCGPDTEMFVNGVEIWNDVFMQYNKDEKGVYLPAKQKNIDTGMGVERVTAILNNLSDNYLSECFLPIIQEIEHLSSKKYKGNERTMRIIADHIKASVFIIADGVTPSNNEQGYILRRLIRRAIINLRKLGFVGTDLINPIAEKVFKIYIDYEILKKKQKEIYNELKKEEEKFDETLEQGLKYFNKITKDKKELSGKDSFLLFQSYGFPIEMTKELAKEKNIKINEKEFEQEFQKHQELSRTSSAGKFKSGLADNSEKTTKLHTATHLLLAALKKVLKDNSIHQMGSNITSERLRFDFNFSRKLTETELEEIEIQVNQWVKEGCPVIREEMTLEEARKRGATGIFESKYQGKISVYTIGQCSKEICTGPHIKNTCEIGKFKIIKEESSSSGVRRIKAIVE
jgi:alanyl-tRNA synthetase